MKTRIALGIVASLVVLAAASTDAEAATKKRGGKGRTRPAAVVTAPAPDAKPASLATAPASKPRKARKGAAAKQAAAKQAAAKHASAKHASAKNAGETRPTSLSTLSAAAAPSAPAPAAPSAPATAPEGREEKAKATPPKGSRFLASGVPLAEVKEGRLAAVGSKKLPCGTKSRWAKGKSRWLALDAWGRPTGTLTVSGSDRDEGSGCHQVRFTEGTGRDGLGVFVAEGSGYTPGPSAEWKADGDAVKRFEQLYAAQERVWVDGTTEQIRSRERSRTLFFSLPKQEASVLGAPTQQRPARWAVSGGRVLVVGYVGANGAWKVGHMLPPTGKGHAYEPLAILDMNGDGLPEIVVHEEGGGVYTDRVLSFDPATMRWENAVTSPGGASR